MSLEFIKELPKSFTSEATKTIEEGECLLWVKLRKSITSQRTQIVRRILIHWRYSIYNELLFFRRQISLHEEAPAQLEITLKRSHFAVVGVDSVLVEPATEVGPWVLNDWKINFLTRAMDANRGVTLLDFSSDDDCIAEIDGIRCGRGNLGWWTHR